MATKPNDDSSLSHTRWNCKYHISHNLFEKISYIKERNVVKCLRSFLIYIS